MGKVERRGNEVSVEMSVEMSVRMSASTYECVRDGVRVMRQVAKIHNK